MEDNLGDIRLLKEALNGSKLPYKLHVAMDGQEALDFLCGIYSNDVWSTLIAFQQVHN